LCPILDRIIWRNGIEIAALRIQCREGKGIGVVERICHCDGGGSGAEYEVVFRVLVKRQTG
jgi:hypothetical protein